MTKKPPFHWYWLIFDYTLEKRIRQIWRQFHSMDLYRARYRHADALRGKQAPKLATVNFLNIPSADIDNVVQQV